MVQFTRVIHLGRRKFLFLKKRGGLTFSKNIIQIAFKEIIIGICDNSHTFTFNPDVYDYNIKDFARQKKLTKRSRLQYR